MGTIESYKSKKIAVLGFGVEGRSTYCYLEKHGIKAAILDQESEEDFQAKNPGLSKNIELVLGNKYLESLSRYDIIFKSPGISTHTPELIAARKAGSIIASQTELFFRLCPSKIIGVTGTKGKGTTSTLIYEILKSSGKDVYLGGNIGVPPIEFLDELKTESLVILELSSFQLQDLEISPNIAVILNITSDHLDHHKTVDEYREAKSNLVRFQGDTDYAVINADYAVPMALAAKTNAQKRYFSRQKAVQGCYHHDGQIFMETDAGVVNIADKNELRLRGEHNLENIAAAIEASYLAGADIGSIRRTVKSFKGLEHRLELVRDLDGVKYYNDSFSTVPETAIAAIRSFDEPKIIILGGSDKGSDYRDLAEVIIGSNIKAVILIGDTAGKILSDIGKRYSGTIITGLGTMEEIVERAKENAGKGDVVLLSPACASFGLFQNYKERGNQFKKAVQKL